MNDEEKALRESDFFICSALDFFASELAFTKAVGKATRDYEAGRTSFPLTPRLVEFTAFAYVWAEPFDRGEKK